MRVRLSVLMSLAMMIAIGCSKTEAEPTILLGEVGSLTGSEATFGKSTQAGIQMAIDEVNSKGGITLNGKAMKVVVRVYDDQGKPEEAANAVSRLINQDKVVAILGEVASSNSLAMAPKAQAAGIPMVTPSSTNPKVTEVGDHIFRVCFIDPFQGAVMAKFARDTLKLDRVAVLIDNQSDYSLGLSSVFVESFKAAGGTIVAQESYSKGDTDFRSQLTSMKGKDPQALYVPGYYTDVGVIARQSRELGLAVPLMGGDGWESEKLFELGGPALEGSYFSNHYAIDDPGPRAKAFRDLYNQKNGRAPDSLSALGYDAAMVVMEAIKRAGTTQGKALRDAIAQTKDHPGIAGTITLDAKRNAVKPAVILQVKGSKAVFVANVAP
jgi:branched-chain amino acid transport system substrate-binding protein